MVGSLIFCHKPQKFNKVKWVEVDDLMTFSNRKYMIDDLANNYQLKSKKYNEIIELLGEPQEKGDSLLKIFYDVDIDYANDIDPIYAKILVFQFNKDSTVKKFEVKEWKK